MWKNRPMRWLIPLALGLLLVVPEARSDDWAQGLESYDGGDYSAALAAWKRAAAFGNMDAVNAIADAYRQGVGVSADPERAAALYRRAAERGNVVAQLNLGDMMSRGVGVGRDAIGAYAWLGLAAEHGNLWAARRQREVARTMTAEQIAIGDGRIRDWKPKLQ
jgi:TPR repeat protein